MAGRARDKLQEYLPLVTMSVLFLGLLTCLVALPDARPGPSRGQGASSAAVAQDAGPARGSSDPGPGARGSTAAALEERARAAEAAAAFWRRNATAEAERLRLVQGQLRETRADLAEARNQLAAEQQPARSRADPEEQNATDAFAEIERRLARLRAALDRDGGGDAAGVGELSAALRDLGDLQRTSADQVRAQRAELDATARRLQQAHRDQQEARQAAADARKAQQAAATRDEALQAKVASLEASLRATREDARRSQARADREEAPSPGLLGGFLRAATRLRVGAVLVGVLGVLSVLGPTSFVRPFSALAGAGLGGLLTLGGVHFLAHPSPPGSCALDAMAALVGGRGPDLEYVLWALFVALGLARWAAGVECVLYEFVDDMVLAENSKAQPLLPDKSGAPKGVPEVYAEITVPR